MRVAPSDSCMVNEDALTGFFGIDESVLVLQVETFNGPDHLLIFLFP